MGVANQSASIRRVMRLDNILDNEAAPTVATAADKVAAAPPAQDDVAMTDAPTPAPERETTSGKLSEDGDEETDNSASEEVEREFECKYNEYERCRTGQVTLKLSRKVISNHFGRNKGCTRLIQDWPLFCRKHYQRATYHPKKWQMRKINLIIRQLEIIEKDMPGTKYTISLKKSEMDRLNSFARATDSGKSLEDAAQLVEPNSDVKSFQAPIDVLREIQPDLGQHKTRQEVQEVMRLIHDMVDQGECEQVPAIEFLPEIQPPKMKPVKKAGPNKAEASSRISSKGAIKKTSK